jgi:hypothetical protein
MAVETVSDDAAAAEFLDSQQLAFLTLFGKNADPYRAGQILGIAAETLRHWRDTCPAFAKVWAEIRDAEYERLEFALLKRLRLGVIKPVFYQGSKIANVREFSDSLGAKMLHEYREYNPVPHGSSNKDGSDTNYRDLVEQKLAGIRQRLIETKMTADADEEATGADGTDNSSSKDA